MASRIALVSLFSVVTAFPCATFAQDASLDGTVEGGGEDDDLSIIGLMVDAGAPDGLTASIIIRPWWWLRAHAGVGHNLVSNGLRGGLTLIPFDTWLTVTLTAEAGHFPQGDANQVARMFAGDFPESVLLQSFGYEWVNAHAGVEFGQEYLTLYLHAGLTYLSTTFGSGTDEIDGTEVTFTESPSIKGWVPSAKVGLIVYLF